jgi:molybdenum cofactor synthesis domain-containing protein
VAPTSALILIGNELLNGAVRDLNLYRMGRQLTRLGFTVGPAMVVRDEPERIIDALRYLWTRSPSVVLCSGGLGPTEDDLTLTAIAEALDRPLALNPEAQTMVERHYDRLLDQGLLENRGPEAARAKMATLPEGATPLANPVGTAPGIRLIHEDVHLYVLPGVPEELETMFAEAVLPDLRSHFTLNQWAERALIVHCEDEADIAEPLRGVVRRHPDVYVKSLAKPFPAASREGLRVIVATSAVTRDAARRAVEETFSDLRGTLEDAGFEVTLPET